MSLESFWIFDQNVFYHPALYSIMAFVKLNYSLMLARQYQLMASRGP